MSKSSNSSLTYYEQPASKNSQFIAPSLKTTPLREVVPSTDEAIFPMKELDLKLFYLIQDYKNGPDYIKTESKEDVPNLKEKYNQFYYSNILDHKRNFNERLKMVENIKHKAEAYQYKLTKSYVDKYNEQKNRLIPKLNEISESFKNEAEIAHDKEVQEEQLKHQKEDEEAVQKSLNQSSRGNVIVDESQLEELMAKLDPLNKYRQVAVNSIPEMFNEPIDQFLTEKFKNFNNVTLDKEKWAEQTTKDLKGNLHAFSEEEEKAFYDGFMLYPKEFGKICKYMKYKRTIPELIAYYYHTKLQKKYYDKYLKMKEDIEKEKELKKQKKKNLKQQLKSGSPVVASSTTPVILSKKKLVEEKSEVKDIKDLTKKLGDQIKDEVLKPENSKEVEVEKEATALVTPKEESIKETVVVADKQNESASTKDNISIIPSSKKPEIKVDDVNQNSEMKPLSLINDNSESKKRKLSTEVSSESEGPSGKKHSSGKTSYWSVHEAGLFPGLLRKYGRDWKAISDDIKTKSVTMIRNYFLKKGKELGFETYVLEHEKLKAEGKLEEPTISQPVQPTSSIPVKHSNIPNNKANLNSNLTGRAQLLTNNVPVNPPALENKRGLTSVLPPLSQHFNGGNTPLSGHRGNGTFMNQTLPPPIKPTLELFPNNGSTMNNIAGFKPAAHGHKLPPLAFRSSVGFNNPDIPTQQSMPAGNGPAFPPISAYSARPPVTHFPMPNGMQKPLVNNLQYQYPNKPAAERDGHTDFKKNPLSIPSTPGSTSSYSRPNNKGAFIDPLSALAAIASNEQKLMEAKEVKKK